MNFTIRLKCFINTSLWLSLALILLNSITVTAQQQADNPLLRLQTNSSIFFGSGSAELSESALKTLDDFLLKYNDSLPSEVHLQAFTDDKGKKEANKALAEKRATAVKNYLNQQELSSEMIKIKACSQLQLVPGANIEEQRRQNRRVALELWSETAAEDLTTTKKYCAAKQKNLKDFFKEQQKKANQTFVFNAQKGSLIKGIKGTVVQIPPDCFVDSSGIPATGKIELTLREAYDAKDLILQNLSTTAGDKLLETGGTIFLAAKTENGQELSIADDKIITASMSAKEASLPEMQTFEGEVDSAGNVGWTATQQSVRSVSLLDNFNKYGFNNYSQSHIDKDIALLKKTPEFHLKLPKEMKKQVFRSREPRRPKLRSYSRPQKNDLKNKYAKRKNETSIEYGSRINKKYYSQLKKYNKHRRSNRLKYADYKRDSSDFERALAKHLKEKDAYAVYNNQMRKTLEEMAENLLNFRMNEYPKTYRNVADFYINSTRKNEQMKGRMKQIENEVTNYCEAGNDMNDFLVKLQNSAFKVIDKNNIRKLRNVRKNYDKIPFYRKFHKNSGNSNSYLSTKLRRHKHYIKNLTERVPADANISPYQLRQIRIWRERVDEYYNFKWMLRIKQEILGDMAKNQNIMDQFMEQEKIVCQTQKNYLATKNSMNLIKPKDMAEVYNNAMQIRNMGWINCDRFYRSTRPKQNLEILTNKTRNTVMFLVFEDINSVMRAGVNNSNEGFIAKNIPSNQFVKLIGFRITKSGAEMFVQEGRVAQLNRTKPVFEKKTLQEIENVMAAI